MAGGGLPFILIAREAREGLAVALRVSGRQGCLQAQLWGFVLLVSQVGGLLLQPKQTGPRLQGLSFMLANNMLENMPQPLHRWAHLVSTWRRRSHSQGRQLPLRIRDWLHADQETPSKPTWGAEKQDLRAKRQIEAVEFPPTWPGREPSTRTSNRGELQNPGNLA